MKPTWKKLWDALTGRFRGDAQLSLASFATPVVTLAANLVAARFVRPEDMGIIQALMLVPVYFAFLNLGVFNSLNRDIAFHLGRNDDGTVQRLVDASWSVARALSLLGAVVALGLATVLWIRGYSSLHLWATFCAACWLVSDPLLGHLESVYRSSRRFSSLARTMLWQNLATLTTATLPVFAGATGAALARGAQGLSRIAFRLRDVPIPPRSRGTLADVRAMIRNGFPILVAGTLNTYLSVADRTVVALCLSTKAVGDLTVASLVLMAVQLAPTTISGLLYPRVSGAMGRGTDQHALRRYVWIGLGLGVAAVIPIALGIALSVGPFTRAFLPQYADGIRAAQIASWGAVALVGTSVNTILAVQQRLRLYVFAISVSLGFGWVLAWLAIRHGYGIDGAVVARCVAQAGLTLFTIARAFRLTRSAPAGNGARAVGLMP